MNFNETILLQKKKVKIKNLLPEIGIEKAREEIVAGLIAENKNISSKYFYDETGSVLFEEITELPEYYPTRTEKTILKKIAPELMNRYSSFEIIELGSGDCSKISILLDAVDDWDSKNIRYIPVDVSSSAIENSADELVQKYRELEINGYVADFIHQINLIPHSEKPRMIFFLGSTIGNFLIPDSINIIRNLAQEIESGDSLLVGFDLIKPESVLHAAYNDSRGVTQHFNKNILNVVNRIIEADFDNDCFDHLSFFNNKKLRVEMHLVANKNCTVNSPFFENPIHFEKGDSIQTENSHKYNLTNIGQFIEATSLSVKNVYTDKKNWFAVVEFGK